MFQGIIRRKVMKPSKIINFIQIGINLMISGCVIEGTCEPRVKIPFSLRYSILKAMRVECERVGGTQRRSLPYYQSEEMLTLNISFLSSSRIETTVRCHD